MKQSRRRELKTNELSVLLQQVYEKLTQYANYLILGLVVVVLGLILVFFMRHNRLAAQHLAWQTYYEIRSGNVSDQPGLVDRAAALAAECAGDPILEPLALELEGDLAYQLAVGPGSKLTEEEKIRQLQNAEVLYRQILERFAHNPETAARLRLSLASTEESLLGSEVGQADLDAIRALYEAVIDGEPTAFQPIAQTRLDTLADRTRPLRIVATQPATRPTTQAGVLPPAPVPGTAPTPGG